MMISTWLLAFAIFLSTSILFWWATKGYYQRQFSQKEWKHWTTRTFHWQGVIFVGTGLTLLIILLLKWIGILPL